MITAEIGKGTTKQAVEIILDGDVQCDLVVEFWNGQLHLTTFPPEKDDEIATTTLAVRP